MTGKNRLLIDNGIYYLRLKGTASKLLFSSLLEFHQFRNTLQQYTHQHDINVLAFCLLENETHLLIIANKDVVEHVKALVSIYTKWHNTIHSRRGSLFNANFPCVLVEPNYLEKVIRHIHRLPIDQHLVATPEIYSWSTHAAYLDHKILPWINTDIVLDRIAHHRAMRVRRYEQYINESHRPEDNINFTEGSHHKYRALASERYIDDIFSNKEPMPALSFDNIVLTVCDKYGLKKGDLHSPRRNRMATEASAVISSLCIEELGSDIEDLANNLNQDKDTLQGALRNLEQHPAIFLQEIKEKLLHSAH